VSSTSPSFLPSPRSSSTPYLIESNRLVSARRIPPHPLETNSSPRASTYLPSQPKLIFFLPSPSLRPFPSPPLPASSSPPVKDSTSSTSPIPPVCLVSYPKEVSAPSPTSSGRLPQLVQDQSSRRRLRSCCCGIWDCQAIEGYRERSMLIRERSRISTGPYLIRM